MLVNKPKRKRGKGISKESIVPALSDSSSPADIMTGSIPMAWKISSVWNDFPWPFPPQMPEK